MKKTKIREIIDKYAMNGLGVTRNNKGQIDDIYDDDTRIYGQFFDKLEEELQKYMDGKVIHTFSKDKPPMTKKQFKEFWNRDLRHYYNLPKIK